MASEDSYQSSNPFISGILRASRLALLLLLIFSLSGCGGCGVKPQTPAEKKAAVEKAAAEKKKKEEEAKKKELEIGSLVTSPHGQFKRLSIKPGHWSSASQGMKANREDFVGKLELGVVGKDGKLLSLEKTPYRMQFERSVTLSKERPKKIKTTFYVPPGNGKPRISTKLYSRNGQLKTTGKELVSQVMPTYQYHFVVLAKESPKYNYIKALDIVSLPVGDLTFGSDADSMSSFGNKCEHYRVSIPVTGKSIPLPDNPLTWTSIAYILWDGINPEELSEEQQQALVDWLHWGGQLIVSGPASLDLLKGSFLNDYLPAYSDGATEIAPRQIANLSDYWTPKKSHKTILSIKVTTPWSGIKWKLLEKGRFVPNSEELLVESHVGRGRILVSAFRLQEPSLINWKSIGNFYNACLMRRPNRTWSISKGGLAKVDWATKKNRIFDSGLVSNVRYFSRDGGTNTNYVMKETEEEVNNWGFGEQIVEEIWQPNAKSPSGVAGWNDFSLSASKARDSLVEAAGVKVPEPRFVLNILVFYLIALVPLNWLFFHALGRVELAWFFAPVIAVACTVVVIWQAQLDIGFVRARSEVAVLEIQADLPRAHLTRYTAVYTSLSSNYDFEFDDPYALAQPFPTKNDFELLSGQSTSNVVFQEEDKAKLQDLIVPSNSTTFLHSEQMVKMQGSLKLGIDSLGRKQITNSTGWNMYDVAIISRPQNGGKLKGYWIGKLDTSTSTYFALLQLDSSNVFAKERANDAKSRSGEDFPISPLVDFALLAKSMEPGETRLVGQIDTIISGLTIQPKASQSRGCAIVIAHLNYGDFSKMIPDTNSRQDINEINEEDFSPTKPF